MYRIITLDGTELGMTDSVLYIKIGNSGSFTPCSVDEAIGVAFNSEPYNLVGHDEIEGAGTVALPNVTAALWSPISVTSLTN